MNTKCEINMEDNRKTNQIRTKVMSGLIWTFGERILAQGSSFVISILLARLLLPKEYGIIAIVMVFINLANVFVTDGFGEALVNKRDSNETDYSTIFFCSLFCSIFFYIVIFFVAPYIASFYEMPLLKNLLRVLALKLPVSAISTVQHAYVSRKMIFKKFFFSTLWGTLISGGVGIFMAYANFGVWALVAQYLLNTLIDTIVLFITIQWKPKFLFDLRSAREMVGYGWKITISSLVNALYGEVRSLLIGKMYSSSELAYYNRGNQFPSLVITNVDVAIGKVVFPAMTKMNEQREQMKRVGRRALKTTAFLVFPLMTGLFVVADPLVKILLTDKWKFCIPFLRYSCIYYMCQPIQTTNWQIIKATGHSEICLKLEIIKKTIGFLIIFLTMKFGVIAIAAGNAAFAILSMLINSIPNKKLINYSTREQVADLLPEATLCVIMGVIVWSVSFISLPIFTSLLLQVIVGVSTYIGLAYAFKIESFLYLINTIRSTLKKSK